MRRRGFHLLPLALSDQNAERWVEPRTVVFRESELAEWTFEIGASCMPHHTQGNFPQCGHVFLAEIRDEERIPSIHDERNDLPP